MSLDKKRESDLDILKTVFNDNKEGIKKTMLMLSTVAVIVWGVVTAKEEIRIRKEKGQRAAVFKEKQKIYDAVGDWIEKNRNGELKDYSDEQIQEAFDELVRIVEQNDLKPNIERDIQIFKISLGIGDYEVK